MSLSFGRQNELLQLPRPPQALTGLGRLPQLLVLILGSPDLPLSHWSWR